MVLVQAWRGVASNLEARGIKPISADALLLASVLDENQKRALRVSLSQFVRKCAKTSCEQGTAGYKDLTTWAVCAVWSSSRCKTTRRRCRARPWPETCR